MPDSKPPPAPSWNLPIKRLLGENGPIAAHLPHFTPRPQQVALAQAVEESLKRGKPCLAEAGTGVGKTFAYLVPLAKWLQENDSVAVVSTHTLALQSQLVERDIPLLLAAIPEWDIRVGVLKGRTNFLCLQDLEAASLDITLTEDPKFIQIQNWSRQTQTGDVAELPFTAPFWGEIAANADTCRQRECRFYEPCFYYKSRKGADECNLLVVNHALFFADLRLRLANTGGPTLIPHYDAVVFDEAHHVEDMATRAFGLEWGSRRVPNLLGRVRKLGAAKVDPQDMDAIETLHAQTLNPFLQADNTEAFVDELLPTVQEKQTFADTRAELCAAIDKLAKSLSDLAENSNDSVERDRCAGMARMASRCSTELYQVSKFDDAPDAEDATAYFRWYQTRRLRNNQTMTTLTRTPLSISDQMQKSLFTNTPRVICTSATLASGKAFTYLKERLGLDGKTVPAPVEVMEGSPFDYEKNCLLYVPRRLADGLPPLNYAYGDPQAQRMTLEILALTEAAQGRTFALFTSYKMLRDVHERLCDLCSFPLFVQGDMPNGKLVEEFVASGNGVLLGTASFWEGVDVRGSALSCVILDKLPFATPSAPMQRARETDVKAKGGDAFRQLSIPQAQLRLKQGFGRLLRSADDKGVVAILDERIWAKSYGRMFLEDLPPCPVTDSREDAVRFLHKLRAPLL